MAQRVVVTGASSGIGAATVRRFAELGYETVAVARREDRLRELAAETGAHVIQCDVTDEAAVARMAEEVRATGGASGLVNNAGGALGTDSVETALNDDWRRMFEVNVIGLRNVTAALLPVLRESTRAAAPAQPDASAGAATGVDAGHGWASILNLTSTAGLASYPGGGGYNAAKYAAHAVTEVLRLELAGEPIRVMEVAPGLVHTEEFTLNRLRGDAAAASIPYENVTPLTAEDVARVLVGAFEQPPHVNQDLIVLRPVAQSSVFHVHRGPLAAK
ncbi:SDR family NAD(P)-dependent oxidoreductase [Leucobacter aridicollis]|uniref:NADP-dependent 3-hydroxy acid dehydrogenase YdfG n=1 Tax=Leucobacter aridicollis TaxID=283878 RepID=A0A852RAB9_9MICO|nr:SDR family NAD(P)-dependent oxidoreductase [Leucobacter aridicollis]MBL3682828.1 SDR family NAD(P)-dependent oxidoreductase [Leucobacter aridicollis]NYD26266.1 NADP-dependent 3-hydroxy acid dehydrogenase YdfG [Leucobacter aridicollis]